MAQDFPAASPDDIKPFCSILWSCHSWRCLVICHLFKKQAVSIGNEVVKSAAYNWPNDLDLPLKPSTDLVKTLVLNIELSRKPTFKWSYPDGAYEDLPTSIIYSNARLVEAHIKAISSFKEGYNEDGLMRSTVTELLKYLKHAVPNFCDLKVQCEAELFRLRERNYWKSFATFLGPLVFGVAKRKLDICFGMRVVSVDLGSICDIGSLTHIRIKGWEYKWTIELIRRCADTLQVLNLDRRISRANISNIIVDGDGDYLVYPSLRQLLIGRGWNSSMNTPLSPFPGAVPFPNLQRFWCLEVIKALWQTSISIFMLKQLTISLREMSFLPSATPIFNE